MDWYVAKIVYRIICGDGQHMAQFDEQIRLIQAPDKKRAFERARLIGNQQEMFFLNRRSEAVMWKFVNVAELYRLPELGDGIEISSRLTEIEHAGKFIEMINDKADQIRSSLKDLTTEPA